jgi:hypothetical protein
MPSSYTIADAGVRSVVITASGNEKDASVYNVNKWADSTKEPSCVTPHTKTYAQDRTAYDAN